MKDSIVSLKKAGQNYVLPLPSEIHPTTENYVVTEGAAGSIILTPVQKNSFKDEAFIRAHERTAFSQKRALAVSMIVNCPNGKAAELTQAELN